MALDIIFIAALLALSSAQSGHATPAPSPTSTKEYIDLKNGFYSKLYEFPSGEINTTLDYLESTGVIEEFFLLPNATLLYPMDSAYKSLPSNVTTLLKGSQATEIVANIIRYHIIPGYFTAADAQDIAFKSEIPNQLGAPLYSANVGFSISFAPSLDNLTANVTASSPDAFDDGISHVLHILDGVLLPTNLSLLIPTPENLPAPLPAPAPADLSAPTTITTPAPADLSAPTTITTPAPASKDSSKSGSGSLSLNVVFILGALATTLWVAL